MRKRDRVSATGPASGLLPMYIYLHGRPVVIMADAPAVEELSKSLGWLEPPTDPRAAVRRSEKDAKT